MDNSDDYDEKQDFWELLDKTKSAQETKPTEINQTKKDKVLVFLAALVDLLSIN